MSGPVIQGEAGGAIDTFAINERVSIDESFVIFRLDFSLINDEFIPLSYILGKITGKDILCPGQNANQFRVPQRAGALPPGCRKLEKVT